MDTNDEPVVDPISQEMKDIKRKLYNAEKARKSYLKNKETISKRRALVRLNQGELIHPSSIEKGEMTKEEQDIVQQYKQKEAERLFVPTRDPTFIQQYNEGLVQQSKGFYTLIPEDTTSDDYIKSLQNTTNKSFNIEMAHQMFDKFIDSGVLMNNKSETQKDIAKKSYRSKLQTIMNIYGSNDLLHLYTNPERFLNKMMTSHVSVGSIKGYVSLLITLYKHSNEECPIQLKEMVEKGQIEKLSKHVKQGIELSKEEELLRLEHEPYYVWSDIKKIVNIINNHSDKDTIDGLRDRVIINMYVKESVFRDNLGSVYVGVKPQAKEDKRNYLNIQTGKLTLKDFKTSQYFKGGAVHSYISPETLQLIRTYLYEMEKIMGKTAEHLIMKNDGSPYKDGKLSNYIISMFEKYAGVRNFSINDLRHSVATHHKDSPTRIKSMIAFYLHHSFEQHLMYERHSKNTLTFPVLTNTISTNKNSWIGERVSVITQNPSGKTIVAIGTIIKRKRDLGESNGIQKGVYTIKFNNRRFKNQDIQLPNSKVIIM